jgi:drug/metabolite transporter (DMT)-like permease
MPETTKPPAVEYALLLLLATLWGGSFTLIKVALADYPPASLVALRVLVGGLVLAALAAAKGLAFPRSLRRWGELFVQGLLQGALPFTLISWGELHIASSLAGVINSTVPVFAFMLSVFVLGSAPFVPRKFAGVVLGLLGVLVIAGAEAIGSLEGTNLLAVLAVLGASVSYACGAVFGHRFDDQPPLVTAAASLLCGSMLMVPISLAVDRPWTLAPGLEATLAAFGLALLSTALASVIFFRLIRTLGSVATTSNAYLRALVSVLFGVFFLSEPLGWNVVLAAALILGGVALITWKGGTASPAGAAQEQGARS